MVGGVTSVASVVAAVSNDHVLSVAIALPETSFTSLVIVTVYVVDGSKSDDGLNMAILPSEVRVISPFMISPFFFNVNVLSLIVELLICLLKLATISEFTG